MADRRELKFCAISFAVIWNGQSFEIGACLKQNLKSKIEDTKPLDSILRYCLNYISQGNLCSLRKRFAGHKNAKMQNLRLYSTVIFRVRWQSCFWSLRNSGDWFRTTTAFSAKELETHGVVFYFCLLTNWVTRKKGGGAEAKKVNTDLSMFALNCHWMFIHTWHAVSQCFCYAKHNNHVPLWSLHIHVNICLLHFTAPAQQTSSFCLREKTSSSQAKKKHVFFSGR